MDKEFTGFYDKHNNPIYLNDFVMLNKIKYQVILHPYPVKEKYMVDADVGAGGLSECHNICEVIK